MGVKKLNYKGEIKRLVNQREWEKALDIVCSLDLSYTKDTELLFLSAKVYEESHHLVEARNVLSRAFSLEPENIEIVQAFAHISIKTNRIEDARMAVDKLNKMNPDDYESLRLSYELNKLLKVDLKKQINLLEKMKDIEYNEKYAYELAESYWMAGEIDRCKSECIRLINYFRSGEQVQKARQLLSDVAAGKRYVKDDEKVSKKALHTPKYSRPSSIKKFKIFGRKTSSSNISKSKDKKAVKEMSVEEIKLPPQIEKEFEGLMGMDSVKAQILKFINVIKLDEKRGFSSSRDSQAYHFMLVGNPGTGKTAVARIIAKVLYLLNIRNSQTLVEVDKSGLVGKYIGHTEEKTKEVIAKAQGGTLFIDEAYSLYDKDNPKDFGREALNVLMKAMEDQRDSFSVILAGYKKQMNEMLDANVGLKSRINYIIEIPDYTDEELLEIADKIAEEKALIITESGKKAIIERINRERIDEKFGNACFIRNLIDEAYSNLANRLATSKHSFEDMFRLEAVDFGVDLDMTPEEEIEETLRDLKELIGLNEVKREVESIVNTMRVTKEMAKRGIIQVGNNFGSMHMAFLGGPGTGKTTVARIIGRIYKALGILKRGDVFVECSRKDLIGEYQGHTGPKTQQKINEALGGILFIDEAYDLYRGERDTFGQEAITTLIAEMENKRDQLVVILAGYKEEINELFDANPGFRSRVNTMIYFEDYSINQLVDIFVAMVKKEGLMLENGVLDKVRDLINQKHMEKDFGNARGVRNILQKVVRNKNNRIAEKLSLGEKIDEEDFLTIKEEDIF